MLSTAITLVERKIACKKCAKKEISQELSEVIVTVGENSVDMIAVFVFQVITLQALIRFQLTEDRLDNGTTRPK